MFKFNNDESKLFQNDKSEGLMMLAAVTLGLLIFAAALYAQSTL